MTAIESEREDIKTCHDVTREMIKQIFDEVIRQKDCTPETQRRIRIKVIHIERDVVRREITALFEHCQRFYSRLDGGQPADPEGFRHCYQTLDPFTTYRLREEKCREWSVKVLIATVDFMKAFDTERHKSLWNGLAQFGFGPQYTSLSRSLYADQQATVLTDKESDVFEIKRRAKQGGPLSFLLYYPLCCLTWYFKRL